MVTAISTSSIRLVAIVAATSTANPPPYFLAFWPLAITGLRTSIRGLRARERASIIASMVRSAAAASCMTAAVDRAGCSEGVVGAVATLTTVPIIVHIADLWPTSGGKLLKMQEI